MGTDDHYHIDVVQSARGFIVVVASGDIDVTGSVDFRRRLFGLLDGRADHDHLVIDLSDTGYVDTYALSVLVDVAIRCRMEDRRLAIVCSEGSMRHALAATGLDQFVTTYDTLDEALGHDER